MQVDQRPVKSPLFDEDAERAVLGGLLRKPLYVADVAQILTPEDFWRPEHQLLFKALLGLSADGKPIDLLTVGEWLGEDLSKVHAGRIAEIFEETLHGESVRYHAGIVKAKAVLRRLHFVGQEIATQAASGAGDPKEMAAEAVKQISYVVRGAVQDRSEHVRPVLSRALDVFDERKRGGPAGIRTGLRDIDALTNGIRPGELAIVAARPGSGKTAFLVQVASYAAQHNDGVVLLFSSELDSQAIAERVLALDAKVNSEYLRNGRHSVEDSQELIRSLERLGDTGLYIDDSPSPTTLQIVSVCRRHAMQEALRLVVIDYMGLITPADHRVARYEQVSRISRELKGLARELNVPVICAAQLNRAVEQRQGQPRLSDLRDSGSIEQDADSVLFLHPSTDKPGVTVGILAKNRYGRTGTVELVFRKDVACFESVYRAFPQGEDVGDDGF